jgi:hypothetical protein
MAARHHQPVPSTRRPLRRRGPRHLGTPVTATNRDPYTALEALAAALDPGEFVTTLVTGTGRRPCLTVTSRHAGTEQSVYADRKSYWSSSAERIAATSDPLTAAHKLATVLRAAPQPAHDW